VVEHGVTIIGRINVASEVPYHASQMYGRNVTAFILNLVKDGKLRAASEDEIILETLLTRGGEIVNRRVREFFSLPQLVSHRAALVLASLYARSLVATLVEKAPVRRSS
jgi:NAD(P) transhydrogenase subunit alpha